jgi:alanyl-tRNA synthetase
MGDPYSELIKQQELISKVIREEENSFFRTLELGIRRMDLLMNECKSQSITVIAGNSVFELYDTYGFPVDLTSLIARENGLSIDEQGFNSELQIQKDRSRAATAVEANLLVMTTQVLKSKLSSIVKFLKSKKNFTNSF